MFDTRRSALIATTGSALRSDLVAPANASPQNALVHAVAQALDWIRVSIETDTLRLPVLSPLAERTEAMRCQPGTLSPPAKPQVLAMLGADPAAAASVLRHATQTMGPDRPVRSLAAAVDCLGVSRVLLEIEALATTTLPAPEGCERTLRKMWTNTVFTAHASRLVAEWVKHPDPDGVYLCALFHNVGEPVIVEALANSEHAHDLLAPPNLNGLVRAHHARVGQALLQAFGLPADFVSMAARHHDPLTTELHALVTIGYQSALHYGYTYLDNTFSPGRTAAALEFVGLHRTRLQAIAPRIGEQLNVALSQRLTG